VSFPDYIEKRLAGPWQAVDDTRHDSWRDVALQLKGEQKKDPAITDEVIFQALRKWIPDKDKLDSELWRTIRGAEKRNPQPAAPSGRNGHALHSRREESKSLTVRRFQRETSGVAVEIPRVSCTITEFLERVFLPGETICICWDAFKPENSPKWIPANSGQFATLETILNLLKRSPGFWPEGNKQPYYNPEAGVWIRINPIKSGDDSGTDASVDSFRHLLVEFDGKPKQEQWAIFLDSKLPISAVIDSGGKSLHAWVRVDANSLEEFRKRQKQVYDYLADYIDDSSNKNPSRFSRLPGVERGENE
jgi:hypothetical protein